MNGKETIVLKINGHYEQFFLHNEIGFKSYETLETESALGEHADEHITMIASDSVIHVFRFFHGSNVYQYKGTLTDFISNVS
jgi:hypothetical protein